MAKHNEIGKKGEELGAQFLVGKGFRILKRNKLFGKKEIDLLVEKDNVIRIVEIKTIEKGSSVMPEDNFTEDKRQNLKYVLRLIEGDTAFQGKRLQVDFLSVIIDFEKRRADCKLVQNIPLEKIS